MWLNEARKILQSAYKKKSCAVKVETNLCEKGFTWTLYVVDEIACKLVGAPTFKEALKKMRLQFHPEKAKSQDVQIKGGKHGK